MHDADIAGLTVLPTLPSRFAGQPVSEDLCRSLTGATIVAFGAPDSDEFEGGGLVLDYIPAGETDTKRLVLAFNELGLWVEAGPIPATSRRQDR